MATREDALRLLDLSETRGHEGTFLVPSEWAGYAHLYTGTERCRTAFWNLVGDGAGREARRFGAKSWGNHTANFPGR
jgi:hypothetical protein